MVFYDNTVVATSCSACSGATMDSDMGMDGGRGTMMGMDGGMGMGNLATSTEMQPIRDVIKGAVNTSYEAGSESVMTVKDVLLELARLNVVGATEETVMDAAMIVNRAGNNAVQFVMDVANVPRNLAYKAENAASMFRTMDMR